MTDLATLEAAYAVRHEVFVREQRVPVEIERDVLDAVAEHVVVTDAGRPVAAGRLVPLGAEGLIGRMAVRRDDRGRRHGTSVLRTLEAAALRLGLRAVELHAQRHAVGFYERAGYAGTDAPPILEAGIWHEPMRKELPLLRAGRDDDAARLTEILAGCFAEYPGCVLDVENEETWLQAPATAYAAKGGRLWVVEDRGRVLACGALRPTTEGTVELKSLYVEAAARGRGIGEWLTRLVEHEARRTGARMVELWSDTRFTAAHRLYERLGYIRLPETRSLSDLSQTTEFHYRKQLA